MTSESGTCDIKKENAQDFIGLSLLDNNYYFKKMQ